MMLDNNLNFSSNQAITASAASTNFFDQLTGDSDTTTYNATPPNIWGQSTQFGDDLGIGKGAGTPRVVVEVGTAFATTTSMQVQLQGAPVDTGVTGNRSSLTFTTYVETDTIAVALLTANTRIASIDWPMRKISAGYETMPRFFQLNYNMNGSASAGTVTADITLGDDDATTTLQQYPNNYHVAS